MIRSNNMQRPKKVLIVDDQEINRDALEIIMENDYDIILLYEGMCTPLGVCISFICDVCFLS